jgi:hypothetical protein
MKLLVVALVAGIGCLSSLLVGCSGESDASTATSEAAVTAREECYPNTCSRGLKDDGPCSCPAIEEGCRMQFGAGYESTCPALRSWASTCVAHPNPIADTTARADANLCYPNVCGAGVGEWKQGGLCDCQTVSSGCATVYGENYVDTCPAFHGFAAACVSKKASP